MASDGEMKQLSARNYHHPGRTRRGVNDESKNRVSSSSWCFLLILVLSGIAQTSSFVPTVTREAKIATTNVPIRPSQQADFSSSSALGMFGGSFDDNNKNNINKNDKEKNWWMGNLMERIRNFVWKHQDRFFMKHQEHGSGNKKVMGSSSSSQRQQQPTLSQFFQPAGIQGNYNNDNNADGYYDPYDEDDDDDDDEYPAGTSMLFKIPARQLKPGGLRLFLMFYLMGMQNTPDRNTWRADQRLMSVNASPKGFEDLDDESDYNGMVEEEEKTYVLEMLYDVDRSGMLQIELLPAKKNSSAEIRICRCGSRPSTSYLMQESVIVDGLLDELQNISGEKDLAAMIPRSDSDREEEAIADEDRLLITDPPRAIEAARESLAFS